ncbi:MAG: hypothetical protein J6T26_07800 [Firmicutes bacterium]|nr:hypothetical protein [Bacillota bacterium]
MSITAKAVLMACAGIQYAAVAAQVLPALARDYRNRKANGGKENRSGIEPGLTLRPFQALQLGVLHGIAGLLLVGVSCIILRG